VRAIVPVVVPAVVAVLVLAAVVAGIVYAGVFTDFSVDRVRAGIESYGALAPLAFMGLIVAGLFVPGPELVLVGIGGAIFGGVEGFVYGWIAAVVGTLLPFLLVRQAVGRYVQRADGIRFRRLRWIDERLAQRGFATVVVLRLLLCMAPPLNWALGATRVRIRHYVLGTAVGVTPGIGLGAYLGDAVGDAGSWAGLVQPGIVLPAIVGLGLLVGSIVVGRRVFGAEAR
jgi:uncharacterized membrane protein YdjX (TVP38/TMEM64 family)